MAKRQGGPARRRTFFERDSSPIGAAPQDVEDMFYDYGAGRSAARAVPFLLLPAAEPLRGMTDESDGAITFDRAVQAGQADLNLSRTLSYEIEPGQAGLRSTSSCADKAAESTM